MSFQTGALIFLCFTASVRTVASFIAIVDWQKERRGEKEIPVRQVIVINKKKAKKMGKHI